MINCRALKKKTRNLLRFEISTESDTNKPDRSLSSTENRTSAKDSISSKSNDQSNLKYGQRYNKGTLDFNTLPGHDRSIASADQRYNKGTLEFNTLPGHDKMLKGSVNKSKNPKNTRKTRDRSNTIRRAAKKSKSINMAISSIKGERKLLECSSKYTGISIPKPTQYKEQKKVQMNNSSIEQFQDNEKSTSKDSTIIKEENKIVNTEKEDIIKEGNPKNIENYKRVGTEENSNVDSDENRRLDTGNCNSIATEETISLSNADFLDLIVPAYEETSLEKDEAVHRDSVFDLISEYESEERPKLNLK